MPRSLFSNRYDNRRNEFNDYVTGALHISFIDNKKNPHPLSLIVIQFISKNEII